MDALKSKKNAGELAEEIDTLGQESETKAVKWVQEVEKRERKEHEEDEAKALEDLYDKRKYTKNVYFNSLYNLAKQQFARYDVPAGYNIDVTLKEDGRLIFGLQKIGFKWYAKGMKPCGEPKYDINCVERLVIQTMIALDELVLQHEQHQTKSGIVLPRKHKFSL